MMMLVLVLALAAPPGDFIVAGPEAERASDHFPVWAEFRWGAAKERMP